MTPPAFKNPPSIFLMTNTFETGGSERQFVLLVNALRERGFCVETGCIVRTGPFQEGMGEVTEYPCGGSLYALRSWRSRAALARFLRWRRFEVAHAFDFYTNLMLIPAARLARVPALIGSHRQLGDLLKPWHFRAQGLAFRFCDRVVCNSRAAAQALEKQGLPGRKIAVIPNGLSPNAFAADEPALPRIPGTLRVGMVARMNNPVKNYPGFLRTAAQLASKFSQVEFLLVGDGPLRPGLERLAQTLGLDGRVRFLGDRHDIPAVLASMDVSVLASFSESQSNAILESMAAGLPVVATHAGGNGDLVREGETGFLVAANDDCAMTNALERFLTHPELREQCGRRGREIAMANFSQPHVLSQYIELYSALLAAKGLKMRMPAGSLSAGG